MDIASNFARLYKDNVLGWIINEQFWICLKGEQNSPEGRIPAGLFDGRTRYT